MKLTGIRIKNFKAIHEMKIDNIENALILVGQNNTGKTTILEAIRAAFGDYRISSEDFDGDSANIEMDLSLEFLDEDLKWLHQNGVVSQYKRYETWFEDFCKKLPSFSVKENNEEGGVLQFTFIAHRDGWVRYQDKEHKNNSCIPQIFPKIYYLDAERDLNQLQGDLLMLQEDELLKRMRADTCMFNQAKKCGHCFSCIGLIEKKSPAELDAFETAKLLDYKLYQLNLDEFAKKVNQNYKKNGGQDEILYSMNRDVERMLKVTTEIHNPAQNLTRPVAKMGKGMRSIYMLSLLETYTGTKGRIPSILMIEDPEIFLHPKLQKVSGEILYRLSRKNQVIFSTHSPNLLANFNSRQIRQIVLDGEGYSKMCAKTDVSAILEDLGYTANDLMNVNFVFIVEGKQDKSRLPLLIRKYYSETYDENGKLSRIAIITTNSCTNIKTYANLKYINTLYLKDEFLMIRDGDGKDADHLRDQLTNYYKQRAKQDYGNLPRVTDRNVLILKYYSFENYFLDPEIMTKIGVIKSVDQFYDILYAKYKEYLYRLVSTKKMLEKLNITIETRQDIIDNMENIRKYVRGHNLYDIFYGRYKGEKENAILRAYIDAAPRENFDDIFDAIDNFVYFNNRKN